MPLNPRSRRNSRLTILALTVLLAPAAAQQGHQEGQHSQHGDPAFHQREATVMPFDLDRTLHIFERTKTGGVQDVVVRNKTDARNLALIRSHLKREAAAFNRGNFADPAFLHGERMPGLTTLRAAGKRGTLKVTYRVLPTGASLTYRSSDPEVVQALHAWFEAQVRDHGRASRLR